MRYLCMLGFSYAAATFCCAYWLPRRFLLPVMALLAVGGIVCLLLRRRNIAKRPLLRIFLCTISAVIAVGAYGLHWICTVSPARALDESIVEASVELQESPRTSAYGYAALGDLRLEGKRYSVRVYLQTDEFRAGDVLSGTFRLKLPSDETEDGMEPGYLRSCGVYLTASPREDLSLYRPEQVSVRHWPALLRQQITAVCDRALSADTAPWFIALLTNQNDRLSYADKNDLKLAGLYQCLCTSGMHINVLLGLISVLCLRNRRLAAFVGLPICLFFWAIAGGTPSVSRAVVMQALLLLAPLLRQDNDTPTSMALALLLMAIRQPDSMAHMGLQLSFLSVGGITLFSLPLYQRILGLFSDTLLPDNRFLRHVVLGTVSSFTTALGALVFTTPLLAWHYGVISLIGPVAGLLTLPVVTVCFAAGLPVTLLLLLLPQMDWLAMPLEWLMRYVITLTHLFADLPALYTSSVIWIVWLMGSYCLLLLFLTGKCSCGKAAIALVLSFCLAAGGRFLWLRLDRSDFRVTMLDVGQGQCLILELGGRVCVIDCGGSNPDYAGEECARWMLSRGIDSIDVLAFTHYHTDHAGGAGQLLSRVEAELVLLPEIPDETGNRALIEAHTTSQNYITEDARFSWDSSCIQVYTPLDPQTDNEACLSFLCSNGQTDLLVTGDMNYLTEVALCTRADLPALEFYVAGHHGSKNANSLTLLEQTHPTFVLVSSSDQYGHPHAQALDRFASVGAAVLRTDELGTITIKR